MIAVTVGFYIIIVVVVLSAEYLMTLVERRLARWRPPAATEAQA